MIFKVTLYLNMITITRENIVIIYNYRYDHYKDPRVKTHYYTYINNIITSLMILISIQLLVDDVINLKKIGARLR